MDENETPLNDIVVGLTDHTTDPSRPFTGQPHTDQGERGKTEVKGIRFRDLSDCAAMAFVDSVPGGSDELRRRAEDGTLNYNDLFSEQMGDWNEMDPVAFIQNICCRVEKHMGIYPNVPNITGPRMQNAITHERNTLPEEEPKKKRKPTEYSTYRVVADGLEFISEGFESIKRAIESLRGQEPGLYVVINVRHTVTIKARTGNSVKVD